MKKWILAITIVGLLSVVGFSVAMAQDTTPDRPFGPGCPNCPNNGQGMVGNQVMHEYISTALAGVLGISVEDFESYRLEGKTFYQIAQDLNLDLDTLADDLSQARQEAIEAAFADGALTQEQYDFLIERAQFGHQHGAGMAGGNGAGRGFGNNYGGNFGGRGHAGNGMQDCPFNQSAPTN